MDLESILTSLTSGLGDDADLTPYDNIRTLFGDLQSQADSAAAKIDELTGENGGLLEQINGLKAKNYDLLTQVGQAAGGPEVTEEAPVDDEEITIDDLFADDNEAAESMSDDTDEDDK